MSENKEKNKYLLWLLIFNLIIIFLFTNAIQWHHFISQKKVVLLICFYIFMLGIIPILFIKSRNFSHFLINSFYKKIQKSIRYLLDERKKFFLIFLLYLSIVVLSICFTSVYAKINQQTYNIIITYFLSCIGFIILTTILLRKTIGEYPERLFLSLLMIVGIFFVLAEPNNLGLTWDDETHYQRVESIANYFDESNYLATDKQYDALVQTMEHKYYSRNERRSFNQLLNESYKQKETVDYRCDFGIYSISYFPYVLGTWLGRGLHFPYTWTFKLAKIFNIFFYGLIFYFAIKKIKFGKILVTVIGLIPTALYMAGNFSYDPWIICLSVYGFSYFFSFFQNDGKKISLKDELFIFGSLFLAFLPKAIYFIMLIPLFFMPSKTFNNNKEHKRYILLLLVTGLTLISTVVFPILFGNDISDHRASGVNSTEQIFFILNNFSSFLSIISQFLIDYLSVAKTIDYTQFYAYLGYGKITSIVIYILIIVAFTDKKGIKGKNGVVTIFTLIGTVLAILFVAIALYITFTPVGAETVLGCQGRYILPILFPFYYAITPDQIDNQINKTIFNSLPMLIMIFTFVFDTFLPLIALY